MLLYFSYSYEPGNHVLLHPGFVLSTFNTTKEVPRTPDCPFGTFSRKRGSVCGIGWGQQFQLLVRCHGTYHLQNCCCNQETHLSSLPRLCPCNLWRKGCQPPYCIIHHVIIVLPDIRKASKTLRVFGVLSLVLKRMIFTLMTRKNKLHHHQFLTRRWRWWRMECCRPSCRPYGRSHHVSW